MNIAELYRMLCSLYGRDHPIDIEHYLLMARDAGEYTSIGNGAIGREALLIRQSGDDLEMGLFIDPSIVAALAAGDVLDHIDELSCAIEGASHFLYVSDRARRGRQASMLEIELQGEVDKFLLIHLIASSRERDIAPELFLKQFERHSFDPSLKPCDLERYETASHFAAKYCENLRKRYFNPLRLKGLTKSARDFFDRDLAAKLKRLIP
ncbi:MAG: hypothetical protein V2A66_04750 [Pseudomonadota bacterium]